ncbi:MAG: DNA primase [Planctomycetota bacterium]|nr:DNA primase [Planctomycetota bacterium]
MSLAFDAKDRVRQSTEIVDLIGSYLELRRQGAMYVGLCPWHDDTHPSMQVNPNRQSWKCWVCNIGGDVFSFVMQKENVDFRGALEILAERAGIELRASRPTRAGDPDDKKTLFAANQWAAEQFHRFLLESSDAVMARQYLAARGISEDSIQSFKIGFSPNHWTWLTDRSQSDYSPKVLEACGLVGKSERSNRFYDKLRGRLIFPIIDLQNRPIAFGGRVLPELEEEATAKGQRVAKYWNSPETRLFSKSENLYGLHLVRENVARSREIVVVEGYTDVVMAWQQGMTNVVAALGTAINERHIKVLKRFADRMTLLLDGDEAGQRRTDEILELFVSSDADLRVLSLPDGLDPFDFLQQHGSDSLRRLLAEAPDALDFRIRNATKNLDLINDTHQSSRALESILKTLAAANRSRTVSTSHLKEQQVIAKVSRMFQVDDQQIRTRIQQLRRSTRQPFAAGRGAAAPPVKPFLLSECDVKEVELLEIFVSDESLLGQVAERIQADGIAAVPLRRLYEIYLEMWREKTSVAFEAVLTHIEDPQLKSLLVEIDERAQKKLADAQRSLPERLEDVLELFHRQEDENRARQLQARLDQAKVASDEEADLLKAHFEMKLQEHQLNQQEESAPKDG